RRGPAAAPPDADAYRGRACADPVPSARNPAAHPAAPAVLAPRRAHPVAAGRRSAAGPTPTPPARGPAPPGPPARSPDGAAARGVATGATADRPSLPRC